MKLHFLSLTVIAMFITIQGASAENLRIDIEGVYFVDSEDSECFGSAERELPVALNLVVDESKGIHLPKGAPLIDGQAAATQMLALPGEAVIAASAAFGDIHWDEANLKEVLPRSDLGFRPTVILLGNLKSDAVQAFIRFSDESCALSINYLKCDGDCTLIDDNWATDLRTGSRRGELSSLSVAVSRTGALAQD